MAEESEQREEDTWTVMLEGEGQLVNHRVESGVQSVGGN